MLFCEDAAEAKPKFFPLTAEPGGYFSGAVNARRRHSLSFSRKSAERMFIPIRRRVFNLMGRTDPRALSIRHNSDGPMQTGRGLKLKGQIIYEMHIGTFTKEGTWRAAAEQLPELARIGITVIEMMPVAEFPGRFGWGYDGVDLFAPSHLYGTPDDLRAFIDRAHSLGLGVILDVVYNHFGPDGNYLGVFSDDYLIREKRTRMGRRD